MKYFRILSLVIPLIPACAYAGSTHCFGKCGVPDTGQTTVYSTGDDGTYVPTATQPSFTDNGNGTITDNRTGLMWAKDGYGAGANYGYGMAWANAITFASTCTLGGYTDWRLPNVKELISIVKYSGTAPFIDATYFPNTYSGYYWTSTTNPADTSTAFVVGFVGDTYFPVSYYAKTGLDYLRLVRGGP